MTVVWSSQPQAKQPVLDRTTRVGRWLFEHRTVIPVPLALPLLLLRTGAAPASAGLLAGGIALVALGETVRLWAVHHIGAISRTRTDRLGPLVSTGPFGFVRNPLYLGNVAVWTGFALLARMVWMLPIVLVLLGLEYHAIVRWEERLLESRLGDRYRRYRERVPRWMPTRIGARRDPTPSPHASGLSTFSLRQTLFSERGTLIAIALGSLALYIKLRT